jgi:Sulfotransferase domain
MGAEKVFCIGLNRTGTKSFAQAVRILGYRSAPWSPRAFEMYRRNDCLGLEAIVEQFDAFDDWPWPLLVPDLVDKYPSAKFVLTRRRSPRIWLESIVRHAARNPRGAAIRTVVYGYPNPIGFEQEYLDFYVSFYAKVDRVINDSCCSDRVLRVCWEDGSGWQELCSFLDRPRPVVDFPHLNRMSLK